MKVGILCYMIITNQIIKGCKKAVDEYEKEVGHRIIKIPIPDVCGTLVISK